jgi:type IV secretory pathway VirD2 relaxase
VESSSVTRDDDISIRPGRIRSSGVQRARPFVAQALAAVQKAGGQVRRGRIVNRCASRFGRGRAASMVAVQRVSTRSRNVVIKSRIVRHSRGGAPLARHLDYLRRDGVTRDGDRGQLFGAGGNDLDRDAFSDRCADDRHHFRFIVSPEDAADMADLKGFTRELMTRMERDLGTSLDWVAVDHWNTGQPHVHVIVRGVAEDGTDLVIARDYITDGMRARARDLVTQELGLRTDQDIARSMDRQVDSDRWTDLDRSLATIQARDGAIDMGVPVGSQPGPGHAPRMGRLRKLERLGLADETDPGRWQLREDAEPTLRDFGRRGDIIKRMHEALADRGIERAAALYRIDATPDAAIVGRLVDRGLHDELSGTAYAIVDGIDGRTHHIELPDLDAAGDSRPGAIVAVRSFEDRKGRQRIALAVRSDLDLSAQVTATGATWLDRQNLARGGDQLGGGFGSEVRDAMEARIDHLAAEGLARRQGQRVLFARDLLDTLRQRELDAAAGRLSTETGLPHVPQRSGEHVSGIVRRRVDLSSGRFAMIDNGMGFALVPWSPSLDREMGKHITGVARGDGGVDWSHGRSKGLGL